MSTSGEDPVSDFLKREEADLAGLDDDAAPPPPAAEEAKVEAKATPPPKPPPPKVLPENVRKWQEEQKRRLERKDAAELVKIGELKVVAAKELADFAQQRSEQLAKGRKLNREAEAELIRNRDSALASSGEAEGQWERITKLCDFAPSHARNHKDVSRLRSMLLQMKAVEGPA